MKQVYQLSIPTFILLFFLGCQKDLSYEPGLGSLDKQTNSTVIVKIFGSYNVDSKLTSANYILVPVNIFVPGPYHIKTDTLNGYSFAAEGIFTHTGKDTVKLIGTGKPIGASGNAFLVSFDTSLSSILVTVNGIAQYKSTFTYNIDGAPIECPFAKAYILFSAFNRTLQITGQTTYTSLGFFIENLNGVIEPGIYDCIIADKMYGRIDYWNPQSSWLGGTNIAGSSMIIFIDQISTTHVSGTFNGILNSGVYGTGTDIKNISKGVFDLPIY